MLSPIERWRLRHAYPDAVGLWAVSTGRDARALAFSAIAQDPRVLQRAARNQAIETYLAYRRAGGDSQNNQIQYFSFVAEAVLEDAQEQAARQLNDLVEPDDPPTFTALIRQLRAVLAGDRDPTLAADPELGYLAAAELRFLLDTLGQAEPDQPQP